MCWVIKRILLKVPLANGKKFVSVAQVVNKVEGKEAFVGIRRNTSIPKNSLFNKSDFEHNITFKMNTDYFNDNINIKFYENEVEELKVLSEHPNLLCTMSEDKDLVQHVVLSDKLTTDDVFQISDSSFFTNYTTSPTINKNGDVTETHKIVDDPIQGQISQEGEIFLHDIHACTYISPIILLVNEMNVHTWNQISNLSRINNRIFLQNIVSSDSFIHKESVILIDILKKTKM